MSFGFWWTLLSLFVLGALSPGPSLALVLRNTLRGGKGQGLMTALGHGLGFGIYACLVALGLGGLLTLYPLLSPMLHWGGVLLLFFLGFRFLSSSLQQPHETGGKAVRGGQAFVQGFLMAILNPKILAWMLALFAPFVEEASGQGTLLAMATMGMCIDGSWYALVAILFSGSNWLNNLRKRGQLLDSAMGILMWLIALWMIFDGMRAH